MTRFWDGRTDGWSDCTPRPAFAFGDAGKKGVTPRKKIESKFLVDMRIYTLCPSYLHSFILLSGFRGVALTRKTGLTD